MCDCTVLTMLRRLCRRRECSSDEQQVNGIEMTEGEYTYIIILICKKRMVITLSDWPLELAGIFLGWPVKILSLKSADFMKQYQKIIILQFIKIQCSSFPSRFKHRKPIYL